MRFTVLRGGEETSLFRFSLAGSEQAIGMALAARAYIEPLDATGLAPISGCEQDMVIAM